MTVEQLITALQSLPAGAEVWAVRDGRSYAPIGHVWKVYPGDKVLTATKGEPIRYDFDRPDMAPSVASDPDWELPV